MTHGLGAAFGGSIIFCGSAKAESCVHGLVLLGLLMCCSLSVAQTPGETTETIAGAGPDEVAETDGEEVIEPEPEPEPEEGEELDTDGSVGDDASSIEILTEDVGAAFAGDIRVSYVYDDRAPGDPTTEPEDLLRTRWRIGGAWGLTERLRAAVRMAGRCSTEDCDLDFYLEPEAPTTNGLADGQVTLDEAYLNWYRNEVFNLAVGRMQTKFVARGGVYAKSLDRNDSNNLRVTWTDGFHGTRRIRNGWVGHAILQLNSEEGASNVRRDPLDFSVKDARRTLFLNFENSEPRGFLLQRAVDLSYLPKSLLKDGALNGRREDYWGLVVRMAGRWPERSEGPRLRVSSEIGYAPATQTRAAADLVGEGDADGLAWNFTASIMDFAPRHSIGINYGRTGAGWLLSPQYRKNEELFEIRYIWRRTPRLALDARARWREDLELVTTRPEGRDPFDVYVRLTWAFPDASP